MDSPVSGVRQPVGPQQDAFHAAANFADRADYGTLILDHVGRILGCGTSIEELFGYSEAQLIGRRISDFVPDLLVNCSAPSFSARYLAYLCNEPAWSKSDARGACGRMIAVEVKLMPMSCLGGESQIFLLNLRRSKNPGRIRHSS